MKEESEKAYLNLNIQKMNEEVMILNYGVREDSLESLWLQGDPTSPS